jgi:hypothetical protein
VLAWADSADALLGLSREDLARDSAELSTTVLQHPDPSYASGVKLTRVFTRKRTKCFLYVWVGRHNYTAIPLSDRDARSVVSALKRAAAELRDSAR